MLEPGIPIYEGKQSVSEMKRKGRKRRIEGPAIVHK